MKKSLKVATITMAASLCMIGGVLCGAQSFAHASSVSIEAMKAYLASINIPEVYLRLASDEEIKNDYYAYYGSNTVAETTVSYLTESGEDGIMPLGLSKDELKFTITATPRLIKSNGVTYINCVSIMVTYEWTILPSYRKKDAIIVNWDSSVLTFASGSFYQFDTRVIGPEDESRSENTVIEFPTEINQGGLGYEFSLKAESMFCTGILGYARFILEPAQSPMYPVDENIESSRRSTAVHAQYCHNWKAFNASIGFSKSGPSVSFASENRTDKMTSSCNVRFKN